MRHAARSRVLGAVLLAEFGADGADHRPGTQALPGDPRDLIAMHFLLAGEMTLARGGDTRRCVADDLVILDLSRPWSVAGNRALHCYTVLVPRRTVPIPLPDEVGSAVLRLGPGVPPVRRLLGSLLAMDPAALADEQALLAGQAVAHLLQAVLMPLVLGNGSAAPIREATLLDRATALIDATLGNDIDVAGLCASLGCSRSALYRAAAPVNGIAELIVRRRLTAVHRILRDPADGRPVAAIAEAAGFSDPGQFSRQFKRVFGTTPGRARAGPRPQPDVGDFDPLLSLIDDLPPDHGSTPCSA